MRTPQRKTCVECRHFMQHYGLVDERFVPIYCGHCTFSCPRAKHPDTPVCKHFIPGNPKTGIFVTKQYLTKQLLNYVLALELFPENKEETLKQETTDSL